MNIKRSIFFCLCIILQVVLYKGSYMLERDDFYKKFVYEECNSLSTKMKVYVVDNGFLRPSFSPNSLCNCYGIKIVIRFESMVVNCYIFIWFHTFHLNINLSKTIKKNKNPVNNSSFGVNWYTILYLISLIFFWLTLKKIQKTVNNSSEQFWIIWGELVYNLISHITDFLLINRVSPDSPKNQRN